MASLDDAKAAKDNFLTKTVLLDEDLASSTKLNLDPKTDGASDVETAIGNYYSGKAGALDGIVPGAGTMAALATAALQDQYISTEELNLTTALAGAKDKLEKGSDKLIEAAIAKAKDLDAAKEAASKADDALDDAVLVFDAVNTSGVAVYKGVAGVDGTDIKVGAGTAIADKDVFIYENALYIASGAVSVAGLAVGTNVTLLAEKDGSSWDLTTAGKALKNVAELLAAYDANEAEIANHASALETLKAAVADVYKNELDYYTVLDPETAISNEAITDALATDVDFSTAVNGIKTEESAKSVQQFTVEISTLIPDTQNAAKVDFDGIAQITIDASSVTTLAGQVGAIVAGLDGKQGTSGATWTVSADINGLITFKADKAAPTAADPVLSSADAGALSVTTVKDGQTVVSGLKATEAKDVADAMGDLEGFNADVAAFLEARGLKDQLDNHNDNINTIDTWFTDNGYVSKDLADTDNLTATSDSDIYFVSALDSGDNATIKNFGALFGEDGGDYLFAGSSYANLTVLDSKFDTTESFGGNVSTLDIFAIEKNGDTTLYFETNAVDGQLDGAANMFTVKLTGVSVDDIVLSDGFITLA